MTWAQTYHGCAFDFEDALAGRRQPVDIKDIAWNLARINRYLGATNEPYTVAEHCLLLQEYAASQGRDARAQLAALVHDAAEAYTGDVTKPMKQMLGDRFRELEVAVERTIDVALELDGLLIDPPRWVKEYDQRILLDERHHLMDDLQVRPWNVLGPPLGVVPMCLRPPAAGQAWLTTYLRLSREAGVGLGWDA